ncbi:MAG: ABC transporter ATP-binding protein [Candidatus Paceibacterota bacterium]|jgi:ATP-binding cassette subfamily B protein
MMKENTKDKKEAGPSLLGLLRPYAFWITALVVLTVAASGLNLVVPKIISNAIDAYGQGNFVLQILVTELSLATIFIFILTYLQSIVQTYASERVARDLRSRLIEKISTLEYSYIQQTTSAKLLTNLTSDVNGVKMFVSMAIASIISSVFLIIGASTLMLLINWKLGITILAVMPVIGGAFFFVFGRVKKLFKRSQEAIDWLNKVINESVLGSALIRLVNSQQSEYAKFAAANTEAKDIGLSILRLFATLIPVINFAMNAAVIIILALGGRFIISGEMTLGDFTAFINYLTILVFPIVMLGMTSNMIAQATASYQRISQVSTASRKEDSGMVTSPLSGDISVKNVSLSFGERKALKNISFSIKAGTKTAIIGPTAAGKTQLLYLLTGLIQPDSGDIEYDGKDINQYDKSSLHKQVGFVFQDSIIFNLTLRENIAFSNEAKDKDIEKAIAAAELSDFIDALPEKLDTVVSERGTSLSGGQKQRVMLARALALDPKILLLDDFTARIDNKTEQKILDNIQKSYPGITLISVTQKIEPIENYDQIILLMEGEVLASGTNRELMHKSPEYMQIYRSQQSTNNYELHT